MERSAQVRTFYCEDHRREPVKLFCYTCRVPICVTCHSETHKTHKCTDLYHAVVECRDQLKHDIDRIVCRASERSNMRQALKEERKKLREQVNVAESEINRRSDELKQLIDGHRKELIQELNNVKEQRLREFEPIKEDIDLHITLLEEFRVEARDMKEKGSQADILHSFDDLHDRADHLQMLHFGKKGQGFTTCDITFIPTSFQDFLTSGSDNNMIGRIVARRETTTADIVVRRLARLVAGGCVMGVTQLLDRLYIVCYKSNSVRVYHAQTHQRLDDVIIKGMNSPADIAACQSTNCIYITDSVNKCAWRVRQGQNKTLTERWMEGVRMPYSLSVTPDGRLLFISRPSRLSIYRPNGRRLNVITLPADVKDPWHAVETTTGTFIVCHGSNFNLFHRVCEISRTGALMKTYGGPPGQGPGQLNQPIRLALDNDGRIFVTDWCGRRLVLLDPQLGSDRILLSQNQEEAHEPQRICYVAESGRLMVGMDTGAVDIYSVHQSCVVADTNDVHVGVGNKLTYNLAR